LRKYGELTRWFNALTGVRRSIVWSLVGAGVGVLIAAAEFAVDHRGVNWWLILLMTCLGALRAFWVERRLQADRSKPPQPPVRPGARR
jgi:hypothetical protein